MINPKQKAKRLGPIKAFRNHTLDLESAFLEQLRAEKRELVKDLREKQRIYLEGLKDLSQARSEGATQKLDFMESSLDHIKAKWFATLKSLRSLEDREKLQILKVMNANKNLKSIEKLEERYQSEIKAQIESLEQKEQDEWAILNFEQD